MNCHGNRKSEGGVNFEPALKAPGQAAFSQRWKQALAYVKAHDMPPEDAPKQPTDSERQTFLAWTGQMKFLSQKGPGPFVLRRLTKAEYGNTLHDLFGVDPAIARGLPDEVFGEGYLNTLSPLQSEQYLGIAHEVVDRILAPADAPPTPVQPRLFGAPRRPVPMPARPRARSPARSPATPIAARPQRRSWMCSGASSIWAATTTSPTPRPSA